MNLPTKIILDYDHVDLFQRYAVKGATLEFLVFVSNQYGPSKVNVYGFGEFPAANRTRDVAQPAPAETSTPPAARTVPTPSTPPSAVGRSTRGTEDRRTPANDSKQAPSAQGIADLYYHSMELYRAGRLAEARAGFVKVIDSGLIPPPMVQTLRGYVQDIDSQLAHERGARP
jgi:hypothetical protein